MWSRARQPQSRPLCQRTAGDGPDMLETAIAAIARACCRFPWLTLLVASMVTLAAVVYTYQHFAINTDTGALISSKLPWRQRELQLDAAFPQRADTILVVVDGATPELAEGAARLLRPPSHEAGTYRKRCTGPTEARSLRRTGCFSCPSKRCGTPPSSLSAPNPSSARWPPIQPCAVSPMRSPSFRRG